MFLAVTAQLPGANGYTGGKVIFIDTEVPIMHIRKFFELTTITNMNLLNKKVKVAAHSFRAHKYCIKT